MNIPVVLLAGAKLSGKSTVANYLKKKYPNSVELSFARSLKQGCGEFFDLSKEQLDIQEEKNKIDERWNVTPRELFQYVGDLLRDYLPNMLPHIKIEHGTILTTIVANKIKKLNKSDNPPDLIIISDGRYLDEYLYVKTLPKYISIRILRNTGNKDDHKSEKENFEAEYNIDNNSTLENLYKQIDAVVDWYLIK